MGRGRQKAKQTKVARRLKYESPEMDLEALQRELSGKSNKDPYEDYAEKYVDPYEDDPYAKYADYAEKSDKDPADDWS